MGKRWETPDPGAWKGVPGRLALRSVQACERGEGVLLVWRRGEEGTGRLMALPMRCGSWRCRRCSWKVGRFDFDRIEKAVNSETRWLYCVFTFAQRAVTCPWEAYRLGYALWDKRLKRRLERRFGKLEYLQTWESHRSGWPHVNVLLSGDGLWEHVDSLRNEWRWTDDGAHGRGRWAHWTAFRKELRDMVAASGLQRADWVEILEDSDGFAWYFAKIAHELTSASHKRHDQTPIMAPAHFRRFRGSRGLIPAPVKVTWEKREDRKTGEITWHAKRHGECDDWTGIVSPKHQAEFDARDPTWSDDWREAVEYQEASRRCRARRAAERAAGTYFEIGTLEA